MTPGATPTHFFTLPFSTDEIVAFRVTYEQSGKIVLQKKKDECELNGNKVIVKLSQEESLNFDSNVITRIQFKGRREDGEVVISHVVKKPTNIVLDREVI